MGIGSTVEPTISLGVPRWFAVKYNRQFVEPYYAPIDRQIRNVKTGEVFVNSLECAKWYGVLEEDLVESIGYNTYVWPILQNSR
jgi:hypothetical protein